MFRVVKAVVNNINRFKYLRHLKRVKYKDPLEDNVNDITPYVEVQNKIDEVNRLQTEVRSNNLRVFSKAITVARAKQFAVYTMPVVLVGTFFSTMIWPGILPEPPVKTKSLDAYKVTQTVFNEEYSLDAVSDGNIYYDSLTGNQKFVKETDKNLYSDEDQDIVYYRIRDEFGGLLAKIIITKDGQLSVDSVDLANNHNGEEYNFGDAEPISGEYAELLDELTATIYDSELVSEDERELLMALLASENKDVLVKVIEHEFLGTMDVELYSKVVTWAQILLCITMLLYVTFAWWAVKEGDIKIKQLFRREDGELVLLEDADERLSLSVKQYKEEFLLAESERIRKIYDLYCEIVSKKSYAPTELLTGYEKKLLI